MPIVLVPKASYDQVIKVLDIAQRYVYRIGDDPTLHFPCTSMSEAEDLVTKLANGAKVECSIRK